MEQEVNKFLFTKEEVANILASYLERVTDHGVIANPRLVVGTNDILLISDVVE